MNELENIKPREEETIRSLDVREQCRMRLPVWFGSRDNYEHGVLEVLANASDEITNNFPNGEMRVNLSDDCRTISVLDTGRGIPIKGETNGIKNYELLFCNLFSGTNYSNMDSDKFTTGSNGVGTCVLNHASTLFEVTSIQNNQAVQVRFEEGGRLTQPLMEVENIWNIEHGSIFKFTLDPEVFTRTVFDKDSIMDILNRLAGANNKLAIYFSFGDEEEKEFTYKTLSEYLSLNRINALSEQVDFGEKEYKTEIVEKMEVKGGTGNTVINTTEIIKFETNKVKASLSLSTEPLQQTFLNYTYLKDGGTVHDGVIDGLRKFFNKGVKKNKLTVQDIEMSFNIVATVLSNNVEFENQTKFSTKKELYKKIVSSYIVENMETVQAENPKVVDEMKKHLEKISAFNKNNNDKVKKLKTALTEKVTPTNRVKKFVDCRTKDKTRRELFIVEGDSALGSCKLGRDSEFQGIIPVRGKILNCLKANLMKIFDSDIIIDLLKVMGCGVEINSKKNKELHSFNLENLNWDKVIICTDADVDGYQIRTLILTMVYVLAPTLIREGKVYIVETPLYEIEPQHGESIFVYSDSERDKVISGLTCKYKVHRSKGLGENDPDMMWHTTMNPETRKLTRVKIDDVEKMQEMFELLLGDDVAPRKKHIEEHGHKYVEL